MIARLLKSEDDLALLERLGLGYPIIEEILTSPRFALLE
jgi:hypothetical protein